MFMKYKILFIIIFSLTISFCSERKNIEKKEPKSLGYKNSKIDNLIFPDTIIANNKTKGELYYNLKLDTIDTTKIIDRFVFLYIANKKVMGGVNKIKETKHDILVDTIGNGKFLFVVNFENLGENYLTLVVQDVVLAKNENPDEPMLEIIRETTVIEDVFVKE